MITLAIIIGVIVVLGIIAAISSGYKERFERNFIFNGSAWGIIIGELLMFVTFAIMLADAPSGKIQFDKNCEESVSSFVDCSLDFVSEPLVAIVTFSPGEFNSNIAEYEDPISGVFVFGLICFVLAWYTNIGSSTLAWGMLQNILQTIIVTAFSILFIAALVLAKALWDKADPGTKRALSRGAAKVASRDAETADDDY